MKRLYQARDRIEAQMLKDFLISHNLQAVVLGDYLSGAAGELPALQFPAVWLIDEGDSFQGQQLLEQFLARGRVENEEGWLCRHCGAAVDAGFEICWNCSTPRQ